MKYLKLYKMFESLKDRLKNFFEDKIDWKLIKFMEECMTEYEDIGYIFYIIFTIFLTRPHEALMTGLLPCLIISLGMLYYGKELIKTSE